MSENSELITLITGTRKGIGRYLAEHYSALGHLVIGCSRKQASFSMPNYEHVVTDVTDEEAIKLLLSHIRRNYGGLDHLINNAGIASMNHTLLTPMKSVRRIFDTNLIGTFMLSQACAKLMRVRKNARIVNFSTVARPLKLEGEAIYASSKAAVESLTSIMARELAPYNITVNAVGPAPTDTDLIRGIPKCKLKALLKRQAIRRLGTFDDIANVIDFFLSDRTNFVTGQTIFLGGI